MSDHCHIPEPTHADRARPRSDKESAERGGREGKDEGYCVKGVVVLVAAECHYEVIAQITIRKRDPSYSVDPENRPRSFPVAASTLSGLFSSRSHSRCSLSLLFQRIDPAIQRPADKLYSD